MEHNHFYDLLRKRERKKETSFRCDDGDDLPSRSRSSTREIQGLVIERSVPSVSRRTDGRTDGRTDNSPTQQRIAALFSPFRGLAGLMRWRGSPPSLPDAPWRRASALHLALHSTAGRTTAHVWGLFNCRPPAAWARSERAPSPPPSLRSVAGVPALWKVVGGESILHLPLSVGLGRLEPPISIARRVVRPSAVQFEEFVCVGC